MNLEKPLRQDITKETKDNFSENIFKHSYGGSGVFEQIIENTHFDFKYSSPKLSELFKIFFDKDILFDYPLKNLDIFKNLRRIDNLIIKNESKEYDVNKILPENYNIYFYIQKNPLLSSAIDLDQKVIFINDDPLSRRGLLTLAHEIGHFQDHQIISEKLNKERKNARFADNIFDIVSKENKKIIIDEERAAWAYALNDTRHFFKDLKIDVDDSINFINENCLKKYQDNINVYSDTINK